MGGNGALRCEGRSGRPVRRRGVDNMTLESVSMRGRAVVADGDTIAALWNRGWNRARPIAWAGVERPEWLRSVMDAFLDAGSEIIVTPTGWANRLAWTDASGAAAPPEGRLREINRTAAEICTGAVREFPTGNRIALGALGACAQLLMLGETTEEELASVYREHALALAEGGVAGFVCTGFAELDALVAAVSAARNASGLPVIGCMRLDAGAEMTETALGVTAPQAAAALSAAGAWGVGLELGDNIDSAQAILDLYRAACDLPVFMRIPAGEGEMIEGRLAYRGSPDEFAERCRGLLNVPGCIIGGGGGVGPEHIAALAARREKTAGKRT